MSNLVSLIFYLFIFSISALIFQIADKKKLKALIYISLLLPVLVGALRVGVGTDYFNYVDIYNNISTYSLREFLSNNIYNLEIGFFALIKISKILTNSSYLIFAVSSALSVIFFYLGLKRFNPKHKALVYFVYLLTVFPITFNAVRQGIALSICFYAFSFIIYKNPFKFMTMVLFASTFHLSALFLIPIYFFWNFVNAFKKVNIFSIRMLSSFSVIIALLLSFLYLLNKIFTISIFDKYSIYSGDSIGSGLGTYFIKIMNLLIFIILYRFLIKNNLMNKFFFFLSVLYVFLSTIALSSTAFNRLSLYFVFYPILLLCTLPDIFHDMFTKHLVICIIAFYAILYFYFTFYIYNTGNVFPYFFLRLI